MALFVNYPSQTSHNLASGAKWLEIVRILYTHVGQIIAEVNLSKFVPKSLFPLIKFLLTFIVCGRR